MPIFTTRNTPIARTRPKSQVQIAQIMCSRPNRSDHSGCSNRSDMQSPPPRNPDVPGRLAEVLEISHDTLAKQIETTNDTLLELKETFMCYKNFTQERLNNLERHSNQLRDQIAAMSGHAVRDDYDNFADDEESRSNDEPLASVGVTDFFGV